MTQPPRIPGDSKTTTQPGAPSSATRDKSPFTPTQDRLWAFLAHLGGIVGFLPSLLIYLSLGDRGEQTRTESAEALNFQTTISIPIVGLYILSGFVTAIPLMGWILGTIFWIAASLLFLGGAVLSVVAAVGLWRNDSYEYPWAVRFIGR